MPERESLFAAQAPGEYDEVRVDDRPEQDDKDQDHQEPVFWGEPPAAVAAPGAHESCPSLPTAKAKRPVGAERGATATTSPSRAWSAPAWTSSSPPSTVTV